MSVVSASGINGSIQVYNDHVLIIKPGAGLRRIEVSAIKRVEYEPAVHNDTQGWIKVVTDVLQQPLKTIKAALVDGNTVAFSMDADESFSLIQIALYELLTKRPNR